MKYEIMQFTEVLIYPNETNFSAGQNTPINIGAELGKALSEGFEIYSAIPFTTAQCAGIKYILRRLVIKKNE